MFLSVQERLILGNLVLPKQGNFLTMELVQAFKSELSFDEEELSEFEVRETGEGVIAWNQDKAVEREFEIGDALRKITVDELQGLDDNKKLTPSHMSLFRKFMLPVAVAS